MAVDIGAIQARLTADTRQFQQALNRAQRELAQTGRAAMRTGRGINRSMREATRSTNQLGAAFTTLKRLAIAAGLVQVSRSLLDVAASMEQARIRINAISGSVEEGNRQFQFAVQVAREFGFNIRTVSDEYGRFLAVAQATGTSMRDTQRAFRGLIMAGRAMGTSTADMARAFRALGQIMGDARVQTQDLFLQLGDTLPGIVPRVAAVMGTTVGEMRKFAAQGKLLTRDVFPALLTAFEQMGGPAAQSANSFAANLERLRTEWSLLINTIEENFGILSKIGDIFSAIADGIRFAMGGASRLAVEAKVRLAELTREQELWNEAIRKTQQEIRNLEASRGGSIFEELGGEEILVRAQERLAKLRTELAAIQNQMENARRALDIATAGTAGEVRGAAPGAAPPAPPFVPTEEMKETSDAFAQALESTIAMTQAMELSKTTSQELARAIGEVGQATNLTNLATQAHTEESKRWQDQQRKAADEAAERMQIWQDIGRTAFAAIETSIDGVIRGTQSLSDAMRNLAQSLALAIGKLLIMRALGGLAGGAGGGAGGGIGGIIGSLIAGAAGGSGATPRQRGGIIRQPELALLGENPARNPEFILNRQQMTGLLAGAGGGGVTIHNIMVNDQQEADVAARQAELEGAVVNIMTTHVSQGEGASFMRALRQRGV